MRVSGVTVRKRVLWILTLSMLLYTVLIGRLAYIQLHEGQWLSDKAEALWSRDIPVEPKRGRILDRNGNVLAYSFSRYSVLAVPRQVKDPETTAAKLAAILNMPEEKVYQMITRNELMVWIHPDGRRISEEKAEQIRNLQLPGIFLTEDSQRTYPQGPLAAHVLGFVGIDNQGLTGLELVYDEKLRGSRGAVSFFADVKGGLMPGQPNLFMPPTNGLDLVTTLDLNIQKILYREIQQAALTYQPEGIIGIVMDPKTGQILAMESYPSFNPENYREYSPEVYNRNLPIWKMYEPGSTFKIITLAAALEEKKVNLYHEHFYDPGYALVAGARLRCWKAGGHGSQTFLEVVENSCNPGFVELGERLGKEKLFEYIREFGFGQKTGIDLRGEATGLLFKMERIGPVELATTAFGQGVSVTPIQQVAAVSAAINGGNLYTPYLAMKWQEPETGEELEKREPVLKRKVISEATSKQVREALESVVAKGTGYRAYIEGFRVGGKTGTAQKVGPDGRYLANNHIVSFIGFAPADDPQVVVYVAVDNPKGTQFGGVVAAPIVGNIIDQTLRYLDVEPRKNGIPKEYRYGDTRYLPVPDLQGMTVTEIRQAQYGLPLDVAGKGNVVIHQSPAPGVKVKEGSAIRIYLGDKSQISQ